MLHIIWLIVKIIGILLLAVLGLLLFLVLLVLLVPVRYRVKGSWHEKPAGTVVVHWLLHIVHVRVVYDEQLGVTVRIFGHRLLQTDKMDEPDASKAREANAFDEPDSREEEDVSQVHMAELGGDEEPIPEEKTQQCESPQTEATVHATDTAHTTDTAQKDDTPPPPEPEKPEGEDDTPPPETGRPGRLTRLFMRLKKWFIDAKKRFVRWTKKQEERLKLGRDKRNQMQAFLEDEENRKTFRLLWRQIKKLLRHLRPRKISGWLRFGFDDPYRTGQVLSAASPFYGFYAKQFSLYPVFDEQVMEGETDIKGSVRIGTILWIGVRVLLNKNVRVLMKKWMK